MTEADRRLDQAVAMHPQAVTTQPAQAAVALPGRWLTRVIGPERQRLPSRRRWLESAGAGLLGLASLPGCTALLPMPPLAAGGSTAAAREQLAAAAEAQGAVAFGRLYDLNLAFDRLPFLPATSGPVELRALLRRGQVAGSAPASAQQWHWRLPGNFGLPAGPELVAWPGGDAAQVDRLALATRLAWVALLGPLAFVDVPLEMDEARPLWIDGRRCPGLRIRRTVEAGRPAEADYLLFFDPDTRLARRVGCQPAGGELVWVDCFDPIDRHGIRWPTRFQWWPAAYGRLAATAGRSVLTGLDVDRLYGLADLPPAGPFGGRATAAAQPLIR